MKKMHAVILTLLLIASVSGQTPQKPPQESEEVIRITTNLVQTDVVVTDKNDHVISDLKLEDFEVYDNGKKQDLKFLEYVGVDTGRRTEGARPSSPRPASIETPDAAVTAKDLKRVLAFVVDDLSLSIQDLPAVRKMLLNFVDNKMQDGDLVAIVRVVGGTGLLQQFTSDRRLLRRNIALLAPVVHPYSASDVPDQVMENPVAAAAPDSPTAMSAPVTPPVYSANDENIRYFRGLAAFETANYVIDSLKEIPGHKSMVLISSGIPLFEANPTGSVYSNVTSLIEQLSDNAARAGVVVNAFDPRGLRATAGVVSFADTPAKSGLGATDSRDATFGRGNALDQAAFGHMLDGATDHLGLRQITESTGGVTVSNTNDFDAGLNKILARSDGYYELAYTPGEKFDGNFHKFVIKVHRSGAKVYNHSGYISKSDAPNEPRTKDEEIIAAARSPLAKRDLDIAPNVSVKFLPENKASVDVNMLIDVKKLQFGHDNNKYTASLDIVGFVFDHTAKRIGGLSQTLDLNLSEEEYRKVMAGGFPYSANMELRPGYYQVRAVVREKATGAMGTFSKYLEIPDLMKGQLAMSSVFLYSIGQEKDAKPTALEAMRTVPRSKDLRYAATIYNPKLKGGASQVRAQLIISQGDKVLFREPEQPLENKGDNSALVKLGQVALAKVQPGHYILTVVVTDPNADKKNQTVSHSVDFTVVN